MEITDERFEQLINQAMDSLPPEHMAAVKNVAIVMADEPDAEQREQTGLHGGQTLLGLYQGVPMAYRQGMQPILPDKITLLKLPLMSMASNEAELLAEIRHTIWHELAHYFGHDHDGIAKLE